MPSISQQFTLSVTIEQFVKACSDSELQELDLLLSREFRRRGLGAEPEAPVRSSQTLPDHENIRGASYYS